MSAASLTIRLDDTVDWGCQGSDEEHAAYEQLVADAILDAYPDADVTVQSVQASGPRVCVTTRDEDGQILTDATTTDREEQIQEAVLNLSRDVWESGAFWSHEVQP